MIKHKILSVEKVNEHNVRIKSEILMNEVINGYGGGTIGYIAPTKLAVQVARESVQWKLTAETNPMNWTPIFEEDFSVLEEYLLSLLPEPAVVGPEVPVPVDPPVPLEEPIVEPVVEPIVEPAPEEA